MTIVCPMTLLSWTELENAETDGAKMKMTFVVVDNDNNVVSNAWIQGGMYCDTGASMGTEFAEKHHPELHNVSFRTNIKGVSG